MLFMALSDIPLVHFDVGCWDNKGHRRNWNSVEMDLLPHDQGADFRSAHWRLPHFAGFNFLI